MYCFALFASFLYVCVHVCDILLTETWKTGLFQGQICKYVFPRVQHAAQERWKKNTN